MLFGRSVGIRTRGLLDPNQARYQTSPHPDIFDIIMKLLLVVKPKIVREFVIYMDPAHKMSREVMTMGYHIRYYDSILRDTFKPKGEGSTLNSGVYLLITCMIILFLACYYLVSDVIPYSDLEVTKQAFSNMIHAVTNGDEVYDLCLNFCREILSLA